MSLSQRLAEYVSACFTGLWVQSSEHEDALREIAQLCREQQWRCAVWDVDRGLQVTGQAADAGGRVPLGKRRGDQRGEAVEQIFAGRTKPSRRARRSLALVAGGASARRCLVVLAGIVALVRLIL